MAEENEMKVEPFVRRTIFSNDIKKAKEINKLVLLVIVIILFILP